VQRGRVPAEDGPTIAASTKRMHWDVRLHPEHSVSSRDVLRPQPPFRLESQSRLHLSFLSTLRSVKTW